MATEFNPSAEDTQTFYDTMLGVAKRGGPNAATFKTAGEEAFRLLRTDRTREWQYGPKSYIRFFQESFTDEQRQNLSAFFSVPEPTARPQKKLSETEAFLKDQELSARFISSALANPSRGHLAVEFDLPVDLVSLAMEQAFIGQSRNIAEPTQHGIAHRVRSTRYINNCIKAVATLKPEWASLPEVFVAEDLPTNDRHKVTSNRPVHINTTNDTWPLIVTDQERDTERSIRLAKQKEKDAALPREDRAMSDSDSATPTSGFSQRLAEGLIGLGSRIRKGR